MEDQEVDAMLSTTLGKLSQLKYPRPSIPRHGFSRLPNELILAILKFARADGRSWKRPFPCSYPLTIYRVACLVSRSWWHCARPLLYKDVVLQNYISCALFARSLQQERSLRALVDAVTLPYRQTTHPTQPILYRRQKLLSREAALILIYKYCSRIVRLCASVADIESDDLLFGNDGPSCRRRIQALEIQLSPDYMSDRATFQRSRRLPTPVRPPKFPVLEELTLQTETVTVMHLLTWMPRLRVLILLGRPVAVDQLPEFLGHAPASLRVLRIAHTKLPDFTDFSTVVSQCRGQLEELVLYNCQSHRIGSLLDFAQLRTLSVSWALVERLRILPPTLEDLFIVTASSTYVPQIKIDPEWPPFLRTVRQMEEEIRRGHALAKESCIFATWADSAPCLQRIIFVDDSGAVSSDIYGPIQVEWTARCREVGLHCSIIVQDS